jgi:hypothetical protein
LLNKVGLTSLITRRTEQSVLFLLKYYIHGVRECISLLQQIYIKVPRRNARNCNTFYLSTSRNNVLLNSPLNFMLGSYTFIDNQIDIHIWLYIRWHKTYILPYFKILLLRAVPVKTSQSIALRCINLMRILVPLTNASFVFKFLISKTMQLTFNTNLCGGKPLIYKEFFISLRRLLFYK